MSSFDIAAASCLSQLNPAPTYHLFLLKYMDCSSNTNIDIDGPARF